MEIWLGAGVLRRFLFQTMLGSGVPVLFPEPDALGVESRNPLPDLATSLGLDACRGDGVEEVDGENGAVNV